MGILIATLCCLWGPGKALRGDDSSHLHDVIDILEKQQQMAMRFFVMGLFSYFISSIMVSWFFRPCGGASHYRASQPLPLYVSAAKPCDPKGVYHNTALHHRLSPGEPCRGCRRLHFERWLE